MFAGEGRAPDQPPLPPVKGAAATRLSTAFDSVTLWRDPERAGRLRRVGTSGVWSPRSTT